MSVAALVKYPLLSFQFSLILVFALVSIVEACTAVELTAVLAARVGLEHAHIAPVQYCISCGLTHLHSQLEKEMFWCDDPEHTMLRVIDRKGPELSSRGAPESPASMREEMVKATSLSSALGNLVSMSESMLGHM